MDNLLNEITEGQEQSITDKIGLDRWSELKEDFRIATTDELVLLSFELKISALELLFLFGVAFQNIKLADMGNLFSTAYDCDCCVSLNFDGIDNTSITFAPISGPISDNDNAP